MAETSGKRADDRYSTEKLKGTFHSKNDSPGTHSELHDQSPRTILEVTTETVALASSIKKLEIKQSLDAGDDELDYAVPGVLKLYNVNDERFNILFHPKSVLKERNPMDCIYIKADQEYDPDIEGVESSGEGDGPTYIRFGYPDSYAAACYPEGMLSFKKQMYEAMNFP